MDPQACAPTATSKDVAWVGLVGWLAAGVPVLGLCEGGIALLLLLLLLLCFHVTARRPYDAAGGSKACHT